MKLKKIFALALTCILVLVFAVGCGDTQTPSSGDGQSSAGNQPTENNQPVGGVEDVGHEEQEVPNLPLPDGATVAAVGQLPEKPLRIAFLSWQTNPFFEDIRVGAEAAQEYLANYNCTVDYISMGAEIGVEAMVAGIESAITQQYDAIALASIQVGAEATVNKAVDSGIPVAIFITASEREPTKRLCLIGQEPSHAGEALAAEMVERSGGEGKYGIIIGYVGDEFHEYRTSGFQDYVEVNAPNMEFVGMYENKDSAETAYSLTMDMMSKDPDLEYIYVTGSGASGAGRAIQELGLTGQVGVYTFDLTEDNIKFIRSGEIYCAIDQSPFSQGFDSCTILYNYLVAGEQPEDFIPVVDRFGTPENINELYPE